ncbi:MAG: hypothetical protein K8S54_07120 [Spirochaetia bacterium]|nr:hypothetical protein [Spirochaetia bacterium]
MPDHPELGKLEPHEVTQVKTAVEGLVRSLKARMGISGQASNLLKDEEIVIQSLLHPERGDVLITILRDHRELHLFISNRRDANAPFVIMDFATFRKHPGRRPIDNIHSLKEGEYGIFLASQQDLDLIKSNANMKVELYSVHLGVHESPIEHKVEHKTPAQFGTTEKWEAIRRSEVEDSTVQEYIKELFGFGVTYARYNQQPRHEHIVIRPDKEKLFVGQLIRDMYPYNVRVILRKEHPDQHKARLADVHGALRKLREEVTHKNQDGIPQGYSQYLSHLASLLADTVDNDPELSRFV